MFRVCSTNSFSSLVCQDDDSELSSVSSPSSFSQRGWDLQSPSSNASSSRSSSTFSRIFSSSSLASHNSSPGTREPSPLVIEPDRLSKFIFARPVPLSLRIDEEPDILINPDSPPISMSCQNSEFTPVIQGINSKDPHFSLKLLPRSKGLNEVFIVDQIGRGSVALFKPRLIARGSDRKMGLSGSVEDALRNEVTAFKCSQVLTQKNILSPTEITYLKVGMLTNEIELLGSDRASPSQSNPSLAKGTIHRFIQGAKDLKELDSNHFFNSEDLNLIHSTQMIAALHILTAYLDGHMGNLMLDKEGIPIAIDFGDMMPSEFRVGARPPCWLKSNACSQPFISDALSEINRLKWATIEAILIEDGGYSKEKIVTMHLSYLLLQKGTSMGLTPNQIECFLIGERPLKGFRDVFRLPSAMHEAYKACVKEGCIDFGKLDIIFEHTMSYLLKKMERDQVPSETIELYEYYDGLAKSMKNVIQLSEQILKSDL